MIITLALAAALIVLVLFVLAVCGIRADDRRRPFADPRSEIEHVTRSVLMYARRQDHPTEAAPTPNPHRDRRR
ncbi:hypothetical protein ACFOY2_12045 [Nonomuraea purpurea]|uniref:Uncharacterized protein n=1 Tax=Nonomuraea purpurea TaxID=1849276 RepID=A0ABV8G5P3_9ACTN